MIYRHGMQVQALGVRGWGLGVRVQGLRVVVAVKG
jgi:hypothetical protein